jgi:signal transduction histidine kinase
MNSMPTSFWGWVAGLQAEERAVLLVVCLIAAVLIVMIVALSIHSIHRNRLDDSLKRELLDRGMSADEIATIMVRMPRTRRIEHVATTIRQGRNQS